MHTRMHTSTQTYSYAHPRVPTLQAGPHSHTHGCSCIYLLTQRARPHSDNFASPTLPLAQACMRGEARSEETQGPMFESWFFPFPGCVALNSQIFNSRGLSFPICPKGDMEASSDCWMSKGGNISKEPGT